MPFSLYIRINLIPSRAVFVFPPESFAYWVANQGIKATSQLVDEFQDLSIACFPFLQKNRP